MNSVDVSICCATYNHSKYLRQALDSILEQNVNFSYEIIVGEDCSTDNSREILDEYKSKYGDIIRLIYREKNVGAKRNFEEVYSLAEGKYIIVLETDDYWISKNKLQLQYNFLEMHPSVIAVAHPSIVVDEFGNNVDYKYPSISGGTYSHIDFRKGLLPGQTTSIMHRNIYKDDKFDLSLINSNSSGPGDLRKVFTLLRYGEIFCLEEKLAAYRYVTHGGSSFVANHNDYTVLKEMTYFYDFISYARTSEDKELKIDAEVKYLMSTLSAFKHRYITMPELISKILKLRYLSKDLLWVAGGRKG